MPHTGKCTALCEWKNVSDKYKHDCGTKINIVDIMTYMKHYTSSIILSANSCGSSPMSYRLFEIIGVRRGTREELDQVQTYIAT